MSGSFSDKWRLLGSCLVLDKDSLNYMEFILYETKLPLKGMTFGSGCRLISSEYWPKEKLVEQLRCLLLQLYPSSANRISKT